MRISCIIVFVLARLGWQRGYAISFRRGTRPEGRNPPWGSAETRKTTGFVRIWTRPNAARAAKPSDSTGMMYNDRDQRSSGDSIAGGRKPTANRSQR